MARGGVAYEKVDYDRRLASENKSRILVSIGVLMTKRHYFLLSIYPLQCTQINNDERNALISVFRFDVGRSLATGLYVQVTFLNRTAACNRAYSVLIGIY